MTAQGANALIDSYLWVVAGTNLLIKQTAVPNTPSSITWNSLTLDGNLHAVVMDHGTFNIPTAPTGSGLGNLTLSCYGATTGCFADVGSGWGSSLTLLTLEAPYGLMTIDYLNTGSGEIACPVVLSTTLASTQGVYFTNLVDASAQFDGPVTVSNVAFGLIQSDVNLVFANTLTYGSDDLTLRTLTGDLALLGACANTTSNPLAILTLDVNQGGLTANINTYHVRSAGHLLVRSSALNTRTIAYFGGQVVARNITLVNVEGTVTAGKLLATDALTCISALGGATPTGAVTLSFGSNAWLHVPGVLHIVSGGVELYTDFIAPNLIIGSIVGPGAGGGPTQSKLLLEAQNTFSFVMAGSITGLAQLIVQAPCCGQTWTTQASGWPADSIQVPLVVRNGMTLSFVGGGGQTTVPDFRLTDGTLTTTVDFVISGGGKCTYEGTARVNVQATSGTVFTCPSTNVTTGASATIAIDGGRVQPGTITGPAAATGVLTFLTTTNPSASQVIFSAGNSITNLALLHLWNAYPGGVSAPYFTVTPPDQTSVVVEVTGATGWITRGLTVNAPGKLVMSGMEGSAVVMQNDMQIYVPTFETRNATYHLITCYNSATSQFKVVNSGGAVLAPGSVWRITGLNGAIFLDMNQNPIVGPQATLWITGVDGYNSGAYFGTVTVKHLNITDCRFQSWFSPIYGTNVLGDLTVTGSTIMYQYFLGGLNVGGTYSCLGAQCRTQTNTNDITTPVVVNNVVVGTSGTWLRFETERGVFGSVQPVTGTGIFALFSNTAAGGLFRILTGSLTAYQFDQSNCRLDMLGGGVSVSSSYRHEGPGNVVLNVSAVATADIVLPMINFAAGVNSDVYVLAPGRTFNGGSYWQCGGSGPCNVTIVSTGTGTATVVMPFQMLGGGVSRVTFQTLSVPNTLAPFSASISLGGAWTIPELYVDGCYVYLTPASAPSLPRIAVINNAYLKFLANGGTGLLEMAGGSNILESGTSSFSASMVMVYSGDALLQITNSGNALTCGSIGALSNTQTLIVRCTATGGACGANINFIAPPLKKVVLQGSATGGILQVQPGAGAANTWLVPIVIDKSVRTLGNVFRAGLGVNFTSDSLTRLDTGAGIVTSAVYASGPGVTFVAVFVSASANLGVVNVGSGVLFNLTSAATIVNVDSVVGFTDNSGSRLWVNAASGASVGMTVANDVTIDGVDLASDGASLVRLTVTGNLLTHNLVMSGTQTEVLMGANKNVVVDTLRNTGFASKITVTGTGTITFHTGMTLSGKLELDADGTPMTLGAIQGVGTTPPPILLLKMTSGTGTATATSWTSVFALVELTATTLDVTGGGSPSLNAWTCRGYQHAHIIAHGTNNVQCANTDIPGDLTIEVDASSVSLGVVSSSTGPFTLLNSASASVTATSISGTAGTITFAGPGLVSWTSVPSGVSRPLVVGTQVTFAGSNNLQFIPSLNFTGPSSSPSLTAATSGLWVGSGTTRITVQGVRDAQVAVSGTGLITALYTTIEDPGGSLEYQAGSGGTIVGCGTILGPGKFIVSSGEGGALTVSINGMDGSVFQPLVFRNSPALTWPLYGGGVPRGVEVNNAVLKITNGPGTFDVTNAATVTVKNNGALVLSSDINFNCGSMFAIGPGGNALNVSGTGTITLLSLFVDQTFDIAVQNGVANLGSVSGAGGNAVRFYGFGSTGSQLQTSSVSGVIDAWHIYTNGAASTSAARVDWSINGDVVGASDIYVWYPVELHIGAAASGRLVNNVHLKGACQLVMEMNTALSGTTDGDVGSAIFFNAGSTLGLHAPVNGAVDAHFATGSVILPHASGDYGTTGKISVSTGVTVDATTSPHAFGKLWLDAGAAVDFIGNFGVALFDIALGGSNVLNVHDSVLLSVSGNTLSERVDLYDSSGLVLDGSATRLEGPNAVLTVHNGNGVRLQNGAVFGGATGAGFAAAGPAGYIELAGGGSLLHAYGTIAQGTTLHVTNSGNSTAGQWSTLGGIVIDSGSWLKLDTSINTVARCHVSFLQLGDGAGLYTTLNPNAGVFNVSTDDFKVFWTTGAAPAVTLDQVSVNVTSANPWIIDSYPGTKTVYLLHGASVSVTGTGGIGSRCTGCPDSGADASSSYVNIVSDGLNLITVGASSPWDFGTQGGGYEAHFDVYGCLYTPNGALPPSVTAHRPATCDFGGVYGCALFPCSSVGTHDCQDLPPAHSGLYFCNCTTGYVGDRCQTNVNECASNPCRNGATCVDGVNSFTCACAPGYTGVACQTDINECASNPCVNRPCIDGVNAYTCAPNPCASNPCSNGATCVDTTTSTAVSYRCDAAWIDPCLASPCFFGLTCVSPTPPSVAYGCVCTSSACQPTTTDDGQVARPPPPSIVGLYPNFATAGGGALLRLITRGFTGAITLRFAKYANATRLSVSDHEHSSGSSSSSSHAVMRIGDVLGSSGLVHHNGMHVMDAVLNPTLAFTLDDPVAVNITADTSVAAINRQLIYTFTATPFAITSSTYRPFVLSVVPDDGSAAFTLYDSGASLYYPFNPCTNVGERLQYDRNGIPTCTACPTGGYCPGGGRIWPLPGYWSTSEFATPLPCTLAIACPGSATSDGQLIAGANDDGSRRTDTCADGYSGYGCATCADGFYLSGNACFSCGATESDRQQLRFLIAASIIVFAGLTVAVALLSSRHLATLVSGLLVVQQFVVIGKSSTQLLPHSLKPLADLIGFLSVLNFDVQMVKPGCIVPSLGFLDLYWATVSLAFIFAALFVAGAAVRATWVYHFRLKRVLRRVRADGPQQEGDTNGGGSNNGAIVGGGSVSVQMGKTGGTVGGGVSSGAGHAAKPSVSFAAWGAQPPSQNNNSNNNNARRPSTASTAFTFPGASEPVEAGGNERVGSRSTDERDWATSWWDVFRARATLSLLILGSIVFLKVLTLGLQAAYCQHRDGASSTEQGSGSSTRLVVDQQVECYTGAHMAAVTFDYIVIIVAYGIGFPVLSFVLLYRSFGSPKQAMKISSPGARATAAEREHAFRANAKRNDQYGYMYRGLIPSAYFFRLTTFITNWGFALQSVFTSSVGVQLFVPGIFFLLNMSGAAYLWPYLSHWSNLLSVAVGFGGILQVMVYLGLLARNSSSRTYTQQADSPAAITLFLWWSVALAGVTTAGVAYFRMRQVAKERAKWAAREQTYATAFGPGEKVGPSPRQSPPREQPIVAAVALANAAQIEGGGGGSSGSSRGGGGGGGAPSSAVVVVAGAAAAARLSAAAAAASPAPAAAPAPPAAAAAERTPPLAAARSAAVVVQQQENQPLLSGGEPARGSTPPSNTTDFTTTTTTAAAGGPAARDPLVSAAAVGAAAVAAGLAVSGTHEPA